MIEVKNIQSVYFIGIGGIGMSALARYFSFHGKKVAGYDRTSTPLTRKLEEEGLPYIMKTMQSWFQRMQILWFIPRLFRQRIRN